MPHSAEGDHHFSAENPEYSVIDDIQKESDSVPRTNGDLNILPKQTESQNQLPSLPLKEKFIRQTSLPPAIPTTRRPSGAIEALAMGIFQRHPSETSVDSGRQSAYPQREKRRNSEPPVFLGARRPPELGEPSPCLPEENTLQGTHPSSRIYVNMHSSEITDSSNHLVETDMHQTTIPPTILEQEERPYGNVQPPVAKIPVESHDEGAYDINDEHGYLELSNASMAPLEAPQTQ